MRVSSPIRRFIGRPVTFAVVLACICAAVLTSCNTGKGVTDESSQQAGLRVINLVFNAGGPITVTLDSDTIVSGLAFEAQTPYQTVGIGISRTIQTTAADGTTVVSSTTADFLGATNYTYVAFGPAGNATSVLLTDPEVDPGAGNFELRIVNAALGIGPLDIYVTPPGASLDTTTPTIGGIPTGTTSQFALVPFGSVQIRITPANTKEVIFDSVPQTIPERAGLQAVIYARGSGKLVNVALMNLDTSGSGSIVNNLLAQFKVINGSSPGSFLNVFVDSNLVLSNIPYIGASDYQKTPAGSPTMAIQSTATPGAALLTLMPTLLPATDSSIVLTGPLGALQSLVLADNNLPPAITHARVRFVNSSTDLASADVFVNFSRQIAGLVMNTAAHGIEFDADSTLGTSYEIDFNVSGSTVPSLSLPAVILLGGHSYTIYLVGAQAALSAVVTQDN